MSKPQHRPLLTNFIRFKKAFLEDFVKRYNIPLPAITRKSHTKPELIEAIRADQKQFRYLPRQSYRQLLKTVQKYNIPYANKDRYVKQDFIDAIKAYTKPEEIAEVDIRNVRRFQGNFRNWELIPHFFEYDLVHFFDFYKTVIEKKALEELKEIGSYKLQTALKVQFRLEKPEKTEFGVFPFPSDNDAVANKADIKNALAEQREAHTKRLGLDL